MKGKILFGVTALCVATAVWAFVSRVEAAPAWQVNNNKCGDWTCAGTFVGKDTEDGHSVQCTFFAGQPVVHICYSNSTTNGLICTGTETTPSQLCSGTYVESGTTHACRSYYRKCTGTITP